MALLLAVSPSSLCFPTLGAAARRNKNLETATPMTATRTRYHHGSACIFTSSSSSQIYGSSELIMTAGLLASSRRQKRRRVQAVGVVRCEQAKDGGANNSLDIWLGRVAMLGFVAAVGVEIVTGKGVLENVGFTTPLPTVALGLTAVVGLFTAFGVFRSDRRD
ncbi:unnamed protein product [Sphagnum jensenii]|uniref:Uncharacterized protein n=2 Tax=Sphagnum jensenii TaxID=128206 RepID=A0ABP1BJT2_9BRYO